MVKAKRSPILLAIAALVTAACVSACGGSGPPPAEVTPRTFTFTMGKTLTTITFLVREVGEWTISGIELSGSGVGIYSRTGNCDNVILKVTSTKKPKTCDEMVRVFPFETEKTATLTVKGKKVGSKKVELEERVSMNTK